MNIIDKGLLKFDYTLPIYNWFFPVPYGEQKRLEDDQLDIFNNGDLVKVKNRALYFHTPFCQDICSFCPFSRQVCNDKETINRYVDAIIKEIELKSRYNYIIKVPVDSIFFGGGTPSILSTEQIMKIGTTIHKHFDLSSLKEWSFEMNVKTIDREKLTVLKEIGVTHVRTGVQTFHPEYRRLLTISATEKEVEQAVALMNHHFQYVCVDLLYGFNNQSEEDFIYDLEKIVGLETITIDLYPINNYVTQKRLHTRFNEHGMHPNSGLSKFAFNLLANEYMRHHGYLPHNGHGYVKADKEEIDKRPIITDSYSFQYHEAVYGYSGYEVIGFGNNAATVINNYSMGNQADIKKYMDELLLENRLDMEIYEHDDIYDESKGIILHLPYHGFAEKSLIDEQKIHPETMQALQEAIKAGMVRENENRYELTQAGWYWYVNLLFYFMPKKEQELMYSFMQSKESEEGRNVEKSLIDFQFSC